MSAIQCKYINNINIFSFLGWRKMTQKQKNETQKTQNQQKILSLQVGNLN